MGHRKVVITGIQRLLSILCTQGCGLADCSGNKVCRIAASRIAAQALNVEALRDGGFDPQLVCDSMHLPAAQCVDTSVTLLVDIALPVPASVLALYDFTEQAFLEARQVQMARIAAC
jgi:hypothetical protein